MLNLIQHFQFLMSLKNKILSTRLTREYNLGERLRYLWEQRYSTQKQLAELAKVSQATIANIEKSTKDPSVETLRN